MTTENVTHALSEHVERTAAILRDAELLEHEILDLAGHLTQQVLVVNAGVQRISTPVVDIIQRDDGRVSIRAAAAVIENQRGPMLRFVCRQGRCDRTLYGSARLIAEHVAGHYAPAPSLDELAARVFPAI